jgi:hypothetical protein
MCWILVGNHWACIADAFLAGSKVKYLTTKALDDHCSPVTVRLTALNGS